MKIVLTPIKPGDRVDYVNDELKTWRIQNMGHRVDGTWVVGDDNVGFIAEQTAKGGIFHLVEVAHYAPPGVPMIAMTPNRIETLEALLEAMEGAPDSVIQVNLRAMLAEAKS